MLRISTREEFLDIYNDEKKKKKLLDGFILAMINQDQVDCGLNPCQRLDQIEDEGIAFYKTKANSILKFLADVE